MHSNQSQFTLISLSLVLSTRRLRSAMAAAAASTRCSWASVGRTALCWICCTDTVIVSSVSYLYTLHATRLYTAINGIQLLNLTVLGGANNVLMRGLPFGAANSVRSREGLATRIARTNSGCARFFFIAPIVFNYCCAPPKHAWCVVKWLVFCTFCSWSLRKFAKKPPSPKPYKCL